ncbi:hypothetical protein XELAEV_18021498mg, partial [Xenopus laevis]
MLTSITAFQALRPFFRCPLALSMGLQHQRQESYMTCSSLGLNHKFTNTPSSGSCSMLNQFKPFVVRDQTMK